MRTETFKQFWKIMYLKQTKELDSFGQGGHDISFEYPGVVKYAGYQVIRKSISVFKKTKFRKVYEGHLSIKIFLAKYFTVVVMI